MDWTSASLAFTALLLPQHTWLTSPPIQARAWNASFTLSRLNQSVNGCVWIGLFPWDQNLIYPLFLSSFFRCSLSLVCTDNVGWLDSLVKSQNKKHLQLVISSLLPSWCFGLNKTKQVVNFFLPVSFPVSCQWFTRDGSDDWNPSNTFSIVCNAAPTIWPRCKLTWLLPECLAACVSWSVKPKWFS